jgi:cytoskeletal protein CcmA (bactofilin family)
MYGSIESDTDGGRTRRLAFVAIAGLVCLALVAPVASAQSQRTGGTVVLEADETHEGDLDVTAGEVRIHGTVEGDLEATGGSVAVNGTVEGDLDAAGGTVVIGSPARIDGSATVAGGTITVAGAIGDDARLDGGSVEVAPAATIEGDLTYSAEEAAIDETSVTGSVTERDGPGAGPLSSAALSDVPEWAATPLVNAYLFCANFVLGAILVTAAPNVSTAIAKRGADRPLSSGGVGLAAVFGAPFVLGALFLSIVGIPLGFLAVYGLVFAVWAGLVYGGLALGRFGLSLVGREGTWGALAVGLAAISLANAVPYLRVVVGLVALGGLGALAWVLYDRRTGGGDEKGAAAPANG